jgi:tetratricopeptide (TPR) repeat protein
LRRGGEDGESGAEVTHFKSRQTWALLASLATDPATCRRDALALRLWPDSRHSRNNLRPTLTFLRQAIGADTLIEDRDTVRLRPGAVTTDIDEIRALHDQARATANWRERTALLRQAAERLTGSFLEGYDASANGDGWLDEIRYTVESLTARIWWELTEAAERAGERREAFHAARRAYTLMPESAVVRDAVLRLAEHGAERDALLFSSRKSLDWDILLPHFTALARESRKPTVREEQALSIALAACLATLPPESAKAFSALAVFPQSFTARQASEVTGASDKILPLLSEAHLLTHEGERYGMLDAARPMAWRKLACAERERLRERHARYFGEACDLNGTDLFDPAVPLWLNENRRNIFAALEWCCQTLRDEAAYTWAGNLLHYLSALPPLYREATKLCRPVMEEAARQGKPVAPIYPATLLMHMGLKEARIADAVQWARFAVEGMNLSTLPPNETPPLLPERFPDAMDGLLGALHHANLDEDFDAAMQLAESYLPLIPEEGEARRWFRTRLHFQFAENRYARGEQEQALAANREAIDLLREIAAHLPAPENFSSLMPTLHLQRGSILFAQKRYTEALPEFDTALKQFRTLGPAEQQGVADCLQHIGAILAEQGMTGLAQDHIERAIALYAEQEKDASRAAALGTLGDLQARLGNLPEARRLYEEGLVFWEQQKHPRWTRKFQKRLERLSADNGANDAPPEARTE